MHAMPASPTMSDVWHEFPAAPGALAPAVAQRVEAHQPLVPMNVGRVQELTDVAANLRVRPYADGLEWLLVKHLVQVALVASVVLLVLEGGRAPVLSLAYAATSLLLMGLLALADRQRFNDRDPDLGIIEFVAPQQPQVAAHEHPHQHHAHPQPQHYQRPAPLTPLAHQMQVVMPQHVDVT
jgi:hypothetical protein